MPPHNPPRAAEIQASSKPPKPAPDLSSALAETQTVVEITDLVANAGMASRISNLNTANINTNTNRSAQNAVANQQAHAHLTLSITGKAANQVQNLSVLAARGTVDVLTNNEIAQTLMDIKGAIAAFTSGSAGHRISRNPQHLRRMLARLVAQLKHINEVNSRLTGNGKLSNVQGGAPYTIVDQPLYVQAAVTLGFYGVSPAQLNLQEMFKASSPS